MELSCCDFVVSISGSLKIKERTIGGTHQLCQNFWPFSLADRFRALALRQMEWRGASIRSISLITRLQWQFELYSLAKFIILFPFFPRAEEIFAAAIKSPTVSLGISRSHTFVPGKNIAYPPKEEIIQAIPKLDIDEPNQEEQSPRQVFPVTPQKFAGSPSIADSSFKKVNKRILVELMKGDDLHGIRGGSAFWSEVQKVIKWFPSLLGALRNRTPERLRTAEWRKNVGLDCAFPILRDIFSSFWVIQPSCCVSSQLNIAERLKNAGWQNGEEMSRKTGNSQSRAKFSRHVAVLLRKVLSYCNKTE